jgi:hypothetical protein
MMSELFHISAYCLLALLTFLIVAPRSHQGNGIWDDLDNYFQKWSEWFTKIVGDKSSNEINKLDKSATLERIFAGRMASAGLLLLLIFPFHRIVMTDGLIDFIWAPIAAISNMAHDARLDNAIHVASDWRDSEYYLWEVAAFLWTVLQIGSSHVREILRIPAESFIDQRSAILIGISYALLSLLIMIFGTVILIISISFWVIAFEAVVVLILMCTELFLVRVSFSANKIVEAQRGLESALFIEFPAFLAFVLAASFVAVAEGFTSYSSHWSHAFASGASALDLVLANVGLLMIRVFRRPLERSSARVSEDGDGQNG